MDVRDPWEDEKQPSASLEYVFFVILRTEKRTHAFLDAVTGQFSDLPVTPVKIASIKRKKGSEWKTFQLALKKRPLAPKTVQTFHGFRYLTKFFHTDPKNTAMAPNKVGNTPTKTHR